MFCYKFFIFKRFCCKLGAFCGIIAALFLAKSWRMKNKVLLLNGPNLNLLGMREPQVYGSTNLDQIVADLTKQASNLNLELLHLQSNHEGALVERIHQAYVEQVKFILFNPAALTHTSVSLRDALLGVAIPFIELHLSNVHGRDEFRHKSYLADVAYGVIAGFGAYSYTLALQAAHNFLANS